MHSSRVRTARFDGCLWFGEGEAVQPHHNPLPLSHMHPSHSPVRPPVTHTPLPKCILGYTHCVAQVHAGIHSLDRQMPIENITFPQILLRGGKDRHL